MRAVQVLRLTEPQADKLLELRKVHLRNLRELFEDRQRLNLQVRLPMTMLTRLSRALSLTPWSNCPSVHGPLGLL